ncbi:hypothetical protein MP228_009191 [Amoeboaphelidium protococcarum]|nr:hypothetical protein MP228_009191 [Amoeboaphelidium protococcarum]
MSDAGRVVCIQFPECVQSRHQQYKIIVLNLPPEQKQFIEKMQFLCQFREDMTRCNQSTYLKHSSDAGDNSQYTLERSLRLKFSTESAASQFHRQTYRKFKLGGQWLQIELTGNLVDNDDTVDGQVILEGLLDVQSRPNSRHCIVLQLNGLSQQEFDFEYYARTFNVKAGLAVEGYHTYYLFFDDQVSCNDFELHISEMLPLRCFYHAEEQLAKSLFNRFVTEQQYNSQDNSLEYCGDRFFIKTLEFSTDQMMAQGQEQELVKDGSAQGDALPASQDVYEDNSDQDDAEQFLESLAAKQGSSTTQEFDQLSSSQSIQMRNGDQNSEGDLAVILPAVDQFASWSNLGCVLCQRRFQTRLHLEVHLRESNTHSQRFQQFVSDLQKYHHEQAALMFSQFSTQPKQQLSNTITDQSSSLVKRKQSQQMMHHQAEFQVDRQWGIKKQKRSSETSSYFSWGVYESIRSQSSQEVHEQKVILGDTQEKSQVHVNDNSSDKGANAGEKLLKKIGWSGTGGLGKNGQGVKLAFEPQIYKKGKGIGASKSLPLSQYNNNNQEQV